MALSVKSQTCTVGPKSAKYRALSVTLLAAGIGGHVWSASLFVCIQGHHAVALRHIHSWLR
jgi:hypothetical protein